jgi:hypothetical protein
MHYIILLRGHRIVNHSGSEIDFLQIALAGFAGIAALFPEDSRREMREIQPLMQR